MARALARKPLPKPSPESDPRFRRVMEQLKTGAAKTKAHPAAAKKAADAAKAAKGPPNERLAAGKAKQVDKIKEAKEGKPEPASFLAILRAEIAKAMPKTLGETDKFDQTAQQMKGGLKGNVSQQKEASTQDVSGASKQTPAPAGEAKAGGAVPGEPAPGAPAVNAPEGMPAPKSDDDVSLQDSKQDTDAQMKEAEVTPDQLQKANDPRFSAVLDAKTQVARQADTAPAQYRANERATLTTAAATAQSESRRGAAAMIGVRSGSNVRVLTRQQQQKAADEKKRLEVVAQIEGIFTDTKTRVDQKLASLDTEVGALFDQGTDAALNALTSFVNTRIRKYKIDRYLSIPVVGAARWIRDQFLGLPDEVNAFYEQGRQLFQGLMDNLVVRVAALVERRLKEAKDEVARGQAAIKKLVGDQPKELQQQLQQTVQDVTGRFAELERGIEDKKNQLAQALAAKYKEAFDKANEALKKIQDENKGLVAGFLEKLAEVIKALMEFKDKLMAILRKGAETIKLIIADPLGFLSNLIAAVKGGIQAFVGNIAAHLKKGFMTWLFGALSGAGIEIPSDLSLPSILKLVLGVLGITYDKMRAKAVKLIGERNVKIIEKLVEYIRALITGGPAALWEKVKEDLSSLKSMVIDAIQSWLIDTVIKQAVAKIVSLFNPAGAIIQAILAIYNIVMFVVEKAQQIMAFVEAVVNSVHAIATGAIGGAISWIEQALARTIPIVIGFLARLIGLGGISQKIKEFILKVQAKVDAAIDKAIAKIVALVKKLFGKATGKDKDKAADEGEKDRVADLARQQVRQAAARRVPVRLIVAQLNELKRQYPWIQRFEVRSLRNGFAVHMIASDKPVGDVVPHTTDTQRPIIDEYVRWLAEYRTKINTIRAMAKTEKPGKVAHEANRQYRAPMRNLDRIETSVIGGGDEHLVKLIESLIDERQKLKKDADNAIKGEVAASTTGETKSHEDRPFAEYESVQKAQGLSGATVSAVRAKLQRATQEEHSATDGRHWQLWIFKDRSQIRLDIPGLRNPSQWQVNRDAHLAILGPRGEILSRAGVVVPAASEPAHHRVL